MANHAGTTKPLVHIGWLLATDVRRDERQSLYQDIAPQLQALLAQQFPQFTWQVTFLQRHRYAPQGLLDPLTLLEFGLQEKTAHRWDYALVVVSNGLRARERVHTIGVPSSALETAVLSATDFDADEPQRLQECTLALALHLLGHVWGVEHSEEGPMAAPENPACLQPAPYLPAQQETIADRLDEVADKRLEEESEREWNRFSFYWRAFWADPKSILIDIFGYKPWRLPFRMGRLTAATAVSLVILLLAAEAWEVGVNMTVLKLLAGSVTAILIATGFIFSGQNLGEISREVGWREQLTRTRIVVVGTLLCGMITLWLVLFFISLLIGALLPEAILLRWIQSPELNRALLLRHAAFMAMFGVLAGALGGNLEDERDIKAWLLFDEET